MPYPYEYTNANMYQNPNGRKQLSPSFQPGPFDVMCARGKAAYDHEGNQRFRNLVRMHRDAYANAPTKYHKSQIVSHITNTIRQASPQGGFVKLIKGCYYEVGDRAAKEKIGQTFRDMLHTKYTSSTKAKAQARIAKRINERYPDGDAPQQEQQQEQRQSPEDKESDEDVRSSISVVSNDSVDHQKSREEVAKPSQIVNSDLEPLPLKGEEAQWQSPIELSSSSAQEAFSDDLKDFLLDFSL